jgi:hypothetical protein
VPDDALTTFDAGLIPRQYAPSLRVAVFAYSPYGVGHTNLRRPGEMRGTVVGKKGRFRARRCREGR